LYVPLKQVYMSYTRYSLRIVTRIVKNYATGRGKRFRPLTESIWPSPNFWKCFGIIFLLPLKCPQTT